MRAPTAEELEQSLENSEDDFQILAIQIDQVSEKQDWIETGDLAGHPTNIKVDTGAQANVLPYSHFRKIGRVSDLQPSKTVLTNYEGNPIQHFGTVTLPLRVQGKEERVPFFVVKKGRQVLLGLESCELFGLIARVHQVASSTNQDCVSEFPTLFQGLGCTRRPYSLVLKDDARPVAMAPRRVPHALRGPLRKELTRMESEGVIAKMDEASDWVSPLVIVKKKDGRLRVCLDPRHINRSLKREYYELPRREEIEAELAGAIVFSKLDANCGFHQVPLDEETSKICTFSTPFGRYRFLRLPFGIASAPEVFQKAMSEVFEGLPGTRVYIDDVLVWGTSKEQHDERLRAH